MTRTRILRVFAQLTGFVLLFAVAAAPAPAQGGNTPCSIQSIAGNWMFATEVGQQAIFPAADGDITALGTMNIDALGNVSGEFDVTVAEFFFGPDRTYSGSVTVDPDCRGTLIFVTGTGAMRTDSIAVLSSDEMWGMSQDVSNLWTYRVRRISKAPGLDVLSAKIDAILFRLGVSRHQVQEFFGK